MGCAFMPVKSFDRGSESCLLEIRQESVAMPKVSLVVPVYNSALYLDELFSSLLHQTYENIEIICVNDGSNDDSLEVLRRYESLDGRVVVVDKPNSGAAATRNVGIDRAEGDFLCFIDSDDFIELNAIELLVAAAARHQTDVILFGIDYYNDETREFSPHHGAVVRSSIPSQTVFMASEIDHFYKNVIGYTVNKLYKTSFLKGLSLKFPQIGAHEDMPFTYVALSAASRIFYLDKTLYHYRRSRKGSLSDDTKEQYRFMIQALICFKEMLLEHGLWDKNQRNYLNYAVHMCRWKNNDISLNLAKQFRKDCRAEFFDKLGLIDLPEDFFFDRGEYRFYALVSNGTEWPFRLRRIRNTAARLKHRIGNLKRKLGRVIRRVAGKVCCFL